MPEKAVYLDFTAHTFIKRINDLKRKSDPLQKTFSSFIKDQKQAPQLLDTTMGLGTDSFILAALGFNITATERNPILHALQADALQRALGNERVKHIAAKITLHFIDAQIFLQDKNFEIIYLDPMYPRKLKGKVKKELQFLQETAGIDADQTQLFELAMQQATRAVVVKRPIKAAPISAVKASLSKAYGNTRFDIYLRSSKGT